MLKLNSYAIIALKYPLKYSKADNEVNLLITIDIIKKEFKEHGGIMRTAELKAAGLNSRQILHLVKDGVLTKIKRGVYEFTGVDIPDEAILAKLFPTAVIYLESALLHYRYTDRIPSSWQIAVDKNISKSQFKISYPPVTPFYLESKYIDIGIDEFQINGVRIRIYDRERTICDVLRYSNKLDGEVFSNAIQRYIKDKNRNVKRLMEYAKKLRVAKKVKTYIGVWL